MTSCGVIIIKALHSIYFDNLYHYCELFCTQQDDLAIPIMFGTLAPIDFDRGTLEFIENPDPAAAISRNLQDKIRIACNFCRSRKVCLFDIPLLYLKLWV